MSQRGELLFKASYSTWPDEDIVVEADGNGGAVLMIVEGNYPIDYLIKRRQSFSTENAACQAADEELTATSR